MHMLNISILLMQSIKPSVKALVQVDFPVYAQVKSFFTSKEEKMAHFKKLLFCQKIFFGIKLLPSNVQ